VRRAGGSVEPTRGKHQRAGTRGSRPLDFHGASAFGSYQGFG
jgi:hypothetical protein